MTDNTPLVWKLNPIDSIEAAVRDSILDAFPRSSPAIGLKQLSKMLGIPETELTLTGILKDPSPHTRLDNNSQNPILPVALSQGASPSSNRAVVGLPMELACQIVDLTLGRAKSCNKVGLSAGEQGALLYALDRAGGDWISEGGPSFVVRGFLNDVNQVRDYLGHGELVEVKGRVNGEELGGDAYLWVADGPVPKSSSPIVKDLPSTAGTWPISIRVSIGWSCLQANDLKDLATTDVVFLDGLCHPETISSDCFSMLYSGKWRRYGVWIDNRSLKLVSDEERSSMMKTKTYGDEQIQATLEKTPSTDSGSMEVMVHIELGEIKMTVQQAAELLPGRVLNLGRDVDTSVYLRVGDKRIALGELVSSDGSMAVEIKEIL